MSRGFKISILIIVLVAGILIGLWFGTFGWYSICDVCGARRDSVRYFGCLPFHKITQTALSEYANSELVDPSHKHEWLFGHGGGGAVLCAIGDGQHLNRYTQDTNAVFFLRHVKSNRGIDEARLWLHRFLSPGEYMTSFIMLNGLPCDEAAFNAWYAEQTNLYETMKADLK